MSKAEAELKQLKALVRAFLKEIEYVPLRAVDCDQWKADGLFLTLERAVSRRQKKVSK